MDFPVIAEEVRDQVFNASHSMDLYDSAEEVLAILERDKKSLNLVSSSSRSLLENGLDAHRLGSFFVSIVAGDDGYGHKTNTLPFKETLNRMGVGAGDTLVIEGSHVDTMAGKAMGCQTCLFAPLQNSLFHNAENLKSLNADYEIDHLSDLLRLV